MIYDYEGNSIATTIISVKDYGAKGDGTTDDASAIQSALTALKDTGGIIFFPHGIYLIKTSLVFYSNQTLWFESGATLLQGAAINNLLRSYCESTWTGYTGTHDVLIYGGTFDGGAYETNNTLIGTAHAKNITIERCTTKNGYGTWHNIEINSSYNVKIKDCDFEGSRKTGSNGEMLQIDSASASGVYPWDGTNYDGTLSQYIDIEGCIFHDSTVVPAIGNHINAAHKYIRIHDCIFDGLTSTRGAINFTSSVSDVDIHDNTFDGCAKGVGSGGTTYYIHDNRFVDVTDPYVTSSVAHANMINGTYTA